MKKHWQAFVGGFLDGLALGPLRRLFARTPQLNVGHVPPRPMLPPANVCPHCWGPAPGWTSAELCVGWRERPGFVEYHCKEAAD